MNTSLLAFAWMLGLLLVGLGGYAFGWYWRGRYEANQRPELWVSWRRQWEWEQSLKRQEELEDRRIYPPKLKVVK